MLVHEIEDGGYGKCGSNWYVRPPGTPRAVVILGQLHTTIEEDDGTLTVLPSIVYGKPGEAYYWHGWLSRGRWVEA